MSRLGFVAAACLAAATTVAGAGQVDLGGASEAFALLDQAAGARALAMGSAYEAVGEGSAGSTWNPAAPALAQGLDLGLDHEVRIAGTSRDLVALQAPIRGWLSAGLTGAIVNYPTVILRNGSGAYLGQASPTEQGAGLVMAAHRGRWALGLDARYLNQSLPGYTQSRWTGDLGLDWDVTPFLRLAAVGRGIPQADGSLKPRGAGGLDLHGRLGGWSCLTAATMRVDAGAGSELDVGAELGAGASVPVALRAGYSQLFLPGGASDLSQRFSLGAGVGFDRLQVDYAYLPWGDFGPSHRLSLSWHEAQAAPPAPSAREGLARL